MLSANMRYRVAILQKRAVIEEIDKNVQTVIDAIKEAAANGADIVLLPECFLTGYDLPVTYEKSIADDDIRIKEICNAAKENQVGIVLTSFT